MLKQPESMDECLYFTRRTIGPGKAMAWVCRKECPKCKKAKMGKPVAKGKVKTRATEYVCPACGFTEEKFEHENSVNLDVIYTCPHCGKPGEASTPYKKRTWNGVQAYVINCASCQKQIGITRKMKQGKGGATEPDDDDD